MKFFEENGYIIVRQLYTPEEIKLILDTFMKQNENGPVEGLSEIVKDYDPTDPLKVYPRMHNPHHHCDKEVGPLAKRYMLDDRVYRIMQDLFGEEPVACQSMFYFKPAGARGQDFHQDNLYLRIKPGTCMAAWLAVDPADEENGGMNVVPGSHKLDMICPGPSDSKQSFTNHRVAIPEGREAIPANLAAGDMLFFNGSVIHGSYPNSSKDRFRRSFICHYAPASASETASYYKPIYFNGEAFPHEVAEGGGPCGDVFENIIH